MRILHFTVHRENPISYAARLAMHGTPNPRKEEPMNNQTKPQRKPRRMLGMDEVIRLGDWLRQPGNIVNCRTYQQVADCINTAGLGLKEFVTAANAEGLMKSTGMQLHKDVEPVNTQVALELMARIMLKNYDGANPGEVENLMSELRTLFGGA